MTEMFPITTPPTPAAAIVNSISVLLVDDEPLLRQSLRVIIDSQSDLRVVGEAETGAEAESRASELRPDVILMDIRMPEGDGIHTTQRISRRADTKSTRILVLSMYELDEYVYGALRAGASGFLLKDAHPTVLLEAIRRVHGGEALFAPSILTRLIEHYVSSPTRRPDEPQRTGSPTRARHHELIPLTPRETEVLTLIGQGLSNSEICGILHLSGNTVKSHISSVLSKLHARDRAQLVIAAYERGLVGRRP